jgi:hypothetical protein
MSIIRDLFDSKKFVAALIAVATAVAVKLGVPEAQVSELLAVVSPLLVYVGAQGFADIGKERAYAEVAATIELEERDRQRGAGGVA